MEISESIRLHIKDAMQRFGLDESWKAYIRPSDEKELGEDVYMLCQPASDYLNMTIIVGDCPDNEIISSCYHEVAHAALCEMTELAEQIAKEKRKAVRRALWIQYRNAVERTCQRLARAAEHELDKSEA